jgi:hypothetical protein
MREGSTDVVSIAQRIHAGALTIAGSERGTLSVLRCVRLHALSSHCFQTAFESSERTAASQEVERIRHLGY